MPFKKGRKKTGGIQKGVRHHITEIRQNIAMWANEDYPKFVREMNKLTGKSFVDAYLTAIKLIMPKNDEPTTEINSAAVYIKELSQRK